MSCIPRGDFVSLAIDDSITKRVVPKNKVSSQSVVRSHGRIEIIGLLERVGNTLKNHLS